MVIYLKTKRKKLGTSQVRDFGKFSVIQEMTLP